MDGDRPITVHYFGAIIMLMHEAMNERNETVSARALVHNYQGFPEVLWAIKIETGHSDYNANINILSS